MAKSAQEIIREKNELLKEYKRYDILVKELSNIIPFLKEIILKDEDVIYFLKSGFYIDGKTADDGFFLETGSNFKGMLQKLNTDVIPAINSKKRKIRKRIEELDQELTTAV